MEKPNSFSEKPQKSAEELRRQNAELREQIEKLKTQKQRRSSLMREHKAVGEELLEKNRKRKEKQKTRKLSSLYRAVGRFMIGGVLLMGAGALGSRVYFENKQNVLYEDYLKLRDKKKDLEKAPILGWKEKELKKIFGAYSSFNTEYQWQDFLENEKKLIANKKEEIISIADELVEGGTEPITIGSLTTKNIKVENKELKTYLDSFPKGWVDGEVGLIGQEEKDRSASIKGFKRLATCISYYVEKSKIVFHNETKNTNLVLVMRAIGHEIAHANDWDFDNGMSYSERVDLLLAVAKRINDVNRFKSAYVESIEGKTLQEKNYVRACEYWAEICAQYFTDPHSLHIEDFKIVDRQVKKTDPNYNSITTSDQRAEMIRQLLLAQLSE